ncbi:hydrolase [Rhizobium sp. R72]|uniref:hydrolase n=1 Tax=unclassified Rhizobium TaxID=2613769 RepID=UPI000B52D76C|nr:MULTISPECIES: hydrolase [unclassified Rhizobium]OWV98637.1 hydrolase [Rhizobium sp. R72]OWV98671.1 hydrolase [Rhizobium sp. R711]
MLRRNLDLLQGPLDSVGLISCDVFDTLLLRQPRSQRSRMLEGERRFARLLKEQGLNVTAEELLEARLIAQSLAYRALNVGGGVGEVRLSDIVERQLEMLGLPKALTDRRIDIEIAIEKASLFANGGLAMALRGQRQAGIRVIAVSDTALSSDRLSELLNHFHGPGLIDEVYSSAELLATKRSGRLFSAVLQAEKLSASRMLHIGDDALADHLAPHRMGIQTVHIPKGRLRHYMTQADAARSEAIRGIRRRLRPRAESIPALTDQRSFGHAVFGPIVAQFCLNIWLYARQAETQGATLLFCARGGIGIREAFERLLARLGLPLLMSRNNILVSRLVAARIALEARSPCVLDELEREFDKNSFADVAAFLGGRTYTLTQAWDKRFVAARFFDMLATEAGKEVAADVMQQNALFRRHLESIAGHHGRVILCDTGLYGSTQKLLAAGMPERHFETIQFARCNYKGLSEDHFPEVSGLVVEDNLYNPFKVETVILRYWHAIESLFEPAIPSVRQLRLQKDGNVEGNCGDISYGKVDATIGNPLLAGVLDYIDAIADGAQVMRDATTAWSRLKKAITNPTAFDMTALTVGLRSVDFGRSESVNVLNGPEQTGLSARLQSIKSHLWREAAIARDFPRLKSALLPALELAHIVRGVTASLQR